MVAKKAPATAPEKHVLEEELYVEATAFERSASKIDELTVPKVVNRLAQVRDALRRLDVDYKARVAEMFTKAKLVERIAAFETQRSKIKKAMEAAEKKFAERLVKFKEAGGDLPSETDDGVTLTIVEMKSYGLRDGLEWFHPDGATVIDLNVANGDNGVDIPARYIKPLAECIDWKAVEEDIKKNALLVEAGETPKYNVAFAQTNVKLSLRTKLPEVEA